MKESWLPIGPRRAIVFYPDWARILGGIEEALYLQQLYFWSDKGSRKDGFIYKTKEQIEVETTLTRFQQDRVRKKLEEKGLLTTKLIKANGSPILHYKVAIPLVRKLLILELVSYDSLTEKTTEMTTNNYILSDQEQQDSSVSSCTDPDSGGKRIKKGRTFARPTPDEVEDYAKTIDFTIDGSYFCDFYQARGWQVGKSPMKDWKAAVRTWKKHHQDRKPANGLSECKATDIEDAKRLFGEMQ